MSKTTNELGKRAVACKHWRWMPGMRCTHRWTGGIRVLVEENDLEQKLAKEIGEMSDKAVEDNVEKYFVQTQEVVPRTGAGRKATPECGIMGNFPDADSAYPFLPDLTDPATMGCLLALVRDAHKDAYMAAGCDGEDWIVADCDGYAVTGSRSRSEQGALVGALEAAP